MAEALQQHAGVVLYSTLDRLAGNTGTVSRAELGGALTQAVLTTPALQELMGGIARS